VIQARQVRKTVAAREALGTPPFGQAGGLPWDSAAAWARLEDKGGTTQGGARKFGPGQVTVPTPRAAGAGQFGGPGPVQLGCTSGPSRCPARWFVGGGGGGGRCPPVSSTRFQDKTGHTGFEGAGANHWCGRRPPVDSTPRSHAASHCIRFGSLPGVVLAVRQSLQRMGGPQARLAPPQVRGMWIFVVPAA